MSKNIWFKYKVIWGRETYTLFHYERYTDEKINKFIMSIQDEFGIDRRDVEGTMYILCQQHEFICDKFTNNMGTLILR